ncbi:alanine racemase [Metabacillus sediminilitoris]|uniref:Alanine racemase n=1 Tax=Metabacillus sediminilitoris TaxID=2567941 RepID=A0A4S4C5Q7_9BACI|nr:alanine racemase [Metabacillus sediminilitoris]THF82569.1 alanine racemase [Metabacillus sediminilitoris]
MQPSYRDTWAEISVDAIQHNTKQLKKYIGESVNLMAVVKADGYGHGAVHVAKAAIEAGADYLAVAILDEAIELRESGITEPILVMGYTPIRSIRQAIIAGVDLTVFTEDVLDEVIFQAEHLQTTVSIHLKIDTGMTRIGVQTGEEALSLTKKATGSPNVFLKGIFTHFAIADNEDPSYTLLQFERFQSVLSFLEDHHLSIPLKHCCNSAGTMNFPEMHLDMVRVGIALYGLYPDASLKNHPISLCQAMTLKTKIAALKTVSETQPISYGCTYTPSSGSVIATLPIGYADGLSRLLSNRGQFLLQEQKVPVVGRVCMDQTMIDVSSVSACQHGDEVIIFGGNGEAFQSVDEIAHIMGTINYEVVCLIGKRVPRIYLTAKNNTPENELQTLEFA